MSVPDIPFVPENTLDPAAGLNIALSVIRSLVQTAVTSIDQTAPPGSPSQDDMYLVAATGGTATGAWAGQEDNLARFESEGSYWQFYEAGTDVWVVWNKDDSSLYAYSLGSNAGWGEISGSGGGGGGVSTVVNSSAANINATPGNADNYTRFSHAAPTYTFDSAQSYVVGAEYHGRYVGAGSLMITEAGSMTVNPPADGSLEIPPDGSFTVKIVSSTAADLIGVTVP